MSRIFLPAREPFGEMIVFDYWHGVELILKANALWKCRHWESRFIDLYAGRFECLEDDRLRFTYSNRQWLHLCRALRSFNPDTAKKLARGILA